MSQLFVSSWTVARQASLSSTVSWSLLKFISIESRCCLTISSSITHFSFCLQSCQASGSLPVSWLFTSGGPSIRASASVLPKNICSCFPVGLTGLISQSRGLSRVFSNTTVWKYQFFGTQPSLWSNSHKSPYMSTGKTIALTIQTLTILCGQIDFSAF